MDSSGGRGLSPAGAPGSGSVGPPLSILHHGDPRRQSTKSHHSSTQQVPSVRHSVHHHGHHHHHGPPPPPPPHQLESSEDTSDTCLDDHGAGDARSPFFLRSSNRRATGKRPKSGFWSRGKNSNKEDSSVARDSGIGRDDGVVGGGGADKMM